MEPEAFSNDEGNTISSFTYLIAGWQSCLQALFWTKWTYGNQGLGHSIFQRRGKSLSFCLGTTCARVDWRKPPDVPTRNRQNWCFASCRMGRNNPEKVRKEFDLTRTLVVKAELTYLEPSFGKVNQKRSYLHRKITTKHHQERPPIHTRAQTIRTSLCVHQRIK